MPEMSKAVTFTEAQERFIERLMRACESKGTPGYGLVRFAMEDVQPPSTEYLTRDSFLQVNVYAAAAADQITVAWKILTSDGKLNVSQAVFTGFNVNALSQNFIPLTEGFLMSLTVTNTSASPTQRGHIFVQVGVQESNAATTPFYRGLISGYVTHVVALAWPEGSLMDSLTGPGLLATSTTAPAAGADFAFAFPLNTRNWIHSCSATLTTNATAANRIPVFTLLDYAGNIVWQVAPTAAQAASLVYIYDLGEALTLSADANANKILPLPEEAYVYGAGLSVLKSVTANLQGTDQWSGVTMVYERWFDT